MRPETKAVNLEIPILRVHVVEKNGSPKSNFIACEIDVNLKFRVSDLGTYFFKGFESLVYDAMLVAASVEYCDKIQHRPVFEWARSFELFLPVHDPEHWRQESVLGPLHESLEFLTGDKWQISFYRRKKSQEEPPQLTLNLEQEVDAVIPFSNGMDSHAVAWLLEREMGRKLVRIRLNPKDDSKNREDMDKLPFTSVPYSVKESDKRFSESSARSRGFKFALISGIAAYLSKSKRIIVPESGQGALGPTLVPIGQAYEDYRCHPLFTKRVQAFLQALLGWTVRFEYPRLWSTKGETLKKYLDECKNESSSLANTRSCWQQNRQVSVSGKARQCGICAACMLRRLSLHTSGFVEPKSAYVWENLEASNFEGGAARSFEKKNITPKMRDYAIAGVLHLSHLANLKDSFLDAPILNLRAAQLESLEDPMTNNARQKLDQLLDHHKLEWEAYLDSLGKNSFIVKWARNQG
jgi:7-cyano-7-deazaguanine synthase in queuosine biosynthesis